MGARRGSEAPGQTTELLIPDPDDRAIKEAANALLQFDQAEALIVKATRAGEPLVLRPSLVCEFNRLGIQGIYRSAGIYRPGPIRIGNSQHTPPPAADVPRLVEEMCDYVNGGRNSHTPIHVAAYLLWRINWIHPFIEGNGRTARIVSYIMLCARSGFLLPGTKTIPEQIAEDRNAHYYGGLDKADAAFAEGEIDVRSLESMIGTYLARQLVSAYNQAAGDQDEPEYD